MNNRHLVPVAAVLLGVLALALLSGVTASDVFASFQGPADDNEVEFVGIVGNRDGDSWQVDGKPVSVIAGTEIDGIISVGDEVKVEAWVQDDGTLLAREISLWPEGELGDDYSDDDYLDDDSDDDSLNDDSDDDFLDEDSDDDFPDEDSDDNDLDDDSDDDDSGDDDSGDDDSGDDDSDDDSSDDDDDEDGPSDIS